MDELKVCVICERPETATKILVQKTNKCDECWEKTLEFVETYTRAYYIQRLEVVPDLTEAGYVRVREPINQDLEVFECDCGWETRKINHGDITRHVEEHMRNGDKPW